MFLYIQKYESYIKIRDLYLIYFFTAFPYCDVVGSCNESTSAALHPPHALHGSPPFMLSWLTQSFLATPYKLSSNCNFS